MRLRTLWALALALLAVALCAPLPGWGMTWEQVADVDLDQLTIERREVGALELRRIQREWTGKALVGTEAISRLYHNPVTGAWRCIIVYTARPERETLDHELRHCHGWDHI